MADVRMKRHVVQALSVMFALIFCLGPAAASAGESASSPLAAEEAAAQLDSELDPLGRSTPRGTVVGFLTAMDANDHLKAAEYLDLRNLPAEITQYTPEQLAEGLSIVLERAVWIDLEQLSTSTEGHDGDGLPSYRDLLQELPTAQRPVKVLLQRVPDGEGGRIWKFSNATMAELDVLYDEYRYHPAVEWLYDRLPDVSFLSIELFKWVTALSSMALAAPFVLLLNWWLSRILIAPDKPLHKRLRQFLLGPVTVFVVLMVGNQVLENLGVGLGAQEWSRSRTLMTAASIWLLWQLVNVARDAYGQRLINQGRESSIALLSPLTTATKITILLLGLLVWLDNMGYEITAVLTGLGIGGIAVALVLQKPLEDVFGAITLYTQQPVKIGDFGRFGDVTGTVEEINLRTTRIRTLGNSLVSVPNMRLANEAIENLSARQKFLFQPVLKISNDTKGKDLAELLNTLRTLLAENDRVLKESMRVRFTEITLLSFDVSLFAYIDAVDWPDYLAVSESLNLEILELLDRSEISLASPVEGLLDASG